MVSLTIVRYRKALIPFALLAMTIHRLPMLMQKGCSFYKLLGSGKGGAFSLQPDWQQWGLLAVWNNREDLDTFNQSSLISKWWDKFAEERWTILMEPIQSHGLWDAKQPFVASAVKDDTGPVAVLTRATIRWNKINAFWSNVGSVANIMSDAPGYITSIGIGEAPVYRQATFSVWKSVDDVKAFAYASKEHVEVIKKTRDERWYTEELFARFAILESTGTINGLNPLAGLQGNKTA